MLNENDIQMRSMEISQFLGNSQELVMMLLFRGNFPILGKFSRIRHVVIIPRKFPNHLKKLTRF
jgi:hypothetical protein